MSADANVPRARSMMALMAAVNAEIDRLHDSLGLAESDFFCECGDIACSERVTLSRGEYGLLRAEPGPLLAPAHVDRESTAETDLRELRDDLHQLRGALADRANIEQAKGILAERGDMTLQDAFESLRRLARNQRRTLDEVCAQIVAEAGPSEHPSDAEILEAVEESRGR